MSPLLVLVAALLSIGAGARRKHLNKEEIWPGRDVGHITSLNYPREMPANVDHEWIINGVPNSIVELRCSEITLSGDCNKDKITIIDGGSGNVICNSQRNILIRSRSPSFTIIISSGSRTPTKMECVATSSLRYGHSVPSFLTDRSTEIESGEFGDLSKPGHKKTSCPCGWSNKDDAVSRIVGGSETKVNEFPLIVSLVDIQSRTAQGVRYFRFCGGSIITPWHVLTAAHCTLSYVQDRSKELAIIAGDHDHTRWDETDANVLIPVSDVIVHESYDPETTEYDISLLKTAQKIPFSDKVGPVCMPTKPMDMTGKYVEGIGWGMTAHPGTGSNVLKKVWIQVLPLNTCSKYYRGVNMHNQHQLCVFGKERGLCMGDSGGPVVWLDPATNRYTLVGLTSFGRSCSNFYPDIVTDVAKFLPWINRKIKATRSANTCAAI